MRQALRGAGEVESALRRREQATHHVHVDPADQTRDDLRVASEIDLRAGDLREPQEADRPCGAGKRLPADRGREGAGHLEDRRAARRVVVGAGGLVAEVGGQDDLAGGRVGAGDRGDDDVVGRGHHLRRDLRAEDDLLSRGQAGAEVLGLAPRDHEGEAVLALVRREVTPADEIPVVAGPGRRLVGIVGDESGRAALLAGEAVDEGGLAVGEHDPAADGPPLVVLRRCAFADVHELGRDVGVLAVVRQCDGKLREGGDRALLRRDLLERRGDGVPSEVGKEMRVFRRAVGGKALDRGVGQPGGDRLALHELGRGGKTGGALHAMEARELAHRLERGDAVHLGVDGRRNVVRPEGDGAILGRGDGGE